MIRSITFCMNRRLLFSIFYVFILTAFSFAQNAIVTENANAGNPNTSTAQNPTHNYLEGTYSIKLTSTTANGCVNDTTISATFSVKPALNYPALPPILGQNLRARFRNRFIEPRNQLAQRRGGGAMLCHCPRQWPCPDQRFGYLRG